MFLRLVIIAALVCAFLVTTDNGAAAACSTPLPNDIAVQKPANDVPESYARYTGMWGDGRWEGNLCNTLVVEHIDGEGNAKGVYAWDTYTGWRIKEGYVRFKGKIEDDGKLHMILGNGADVTYWFDGDKLKGTYYMRGRTSRIVIQRK